MTQRERVDAAEATAERKRARAHAEMLMRQDRFTDQLNDLLGEWILESALTREEMAVILAKSIAELMSPR
jgi:hypothetical protein